MVDPRHSNDDPITTLPKDDGTYVVTTRSGTEYTFDLTARTVTRTLGERSKPDINDGTHPIREIIACFVGSSGYWRLEPDPGDVASEYYWQATSPIISIDAVGAYPPAAT